MILPTSKLTIFYIIPPSKHCYSNRLSYHVIQPMYHVYYSMLRLALRSLTRHTNSTRIAVRGVTTSPCWSATGLYDIPELQDSNGFTQLTKDALKEGANIVDRIAAHPPDSVEIVRDFDELSTVLCKVADLSECIRQVHPDDKFSKSAHSANASINNYVEQLNTNQALYRTLENFMEHQSFATMDYEIKQAAKSFMEDFKVSGVHLDEEKRAKCVELNGLALAYGQSLVVNSFLPTRLLKERCPTVLKNNFKSDSNLVLVTHAVNDSANSELRAMSYLAYYGYNPTINEVLVNLLKTRHELAEIIGYPSHAHRSLYSTMAKTPETVQSFLEKLSNTILPIAKSEISKMLELKAAVPDQIDPKTIHPWDLAFLEGSYRDQLSMVKQSEVSQYFELDGCMERLSNFLNSLYGIRMQKGSTKEGELWHSDVEKYVVVDENNHLMGTIYFDFFPRPSKGVYNCHFTINVGRKTKSGESELPIITLCFDFAKPKSGPVLLPFECVDNLFHEMGHAIHTIFGCTTFQTVSGTRCTTDFAEVPSILMNEYFLKDTRVLETIGKHHKSGRTLPNEVVRNIKLSSSLFPALETQTQVLYALYDQVSHLGPPTESTQTTFRSIHNKYMPLQYIEQTAWYLRFHHLHGYGARYYSYLWSRAIAAMIWDACFKKDPFSREMGEKYRREVLQYGGSRDAWTLVANILGHQPTVDEMVEALSRDVMQRKRSAPSILIA